ncbi:MAG: DUF1343 domain-containing protein [Bacteroidales bacterium]|nr:DUF1343 domain-containing protein [Bacteroidales bacterium]
MGELRVGAERTELYLPMLRGSNVAILANHTSLVCGVHLVDTLLSMGVNLKKIFCPEHGFRGDVEAGKYIQSQTDSKTGLPLVSLYGKNKKPSGESLGGIDYVLIDLQDVGVRYYTYTSTMHYVMEACAEQGVAVIVLDRPNPNGFYIDGPMLDTATSRSFVGMHPVPLVHGLTIGEYAQMINGERWLKGGIQCRLTVIPCSGYTHQQTYAPPVGPSPNLPNLCSILLYPSLGLFEGTPVSVGRGTDWPFQIFGYPDFPLRGFHFTPEERPHASVNPPYKDELCFGIDLRDYAEAYFRDACAINLDWLLMAYRAYPKPEAFFNRFFKNLAGTPKLRQQIEQGMSADDIRQSWQADLQAFRSIRDKYLLYPDFIPTKTQ